MLRGINARPLPPTEPHSTAGVAAAPTAVLKNLTLLPARAAYIRVALAALMPGCAVQLKLVGKFDFKYTVTL